MAQFQRRRDRIQLSLDDFEREAISQVVQQLTPAVGRALTAGQRAYEEDEPQAEYDRWVRPEVEKARDADIQLILDCLGNEEDVLLLTEPQAFAWLRGINHLRLAAAAVLGADQDGWEETASPADRESAEYRMYLLLSFLAEELVSVLDS